MPFIGYRSFSQQGNVNVSKAGATRGAAVADTTVFQRTVPSPGRGSTPFMLESAWT